LCELNIGTRSQVKKLIRQGSVLVNGFLAKDPDQKIDVDRDEVTFQGKKLKYQEFHYYMLNKPQGVVTATEDRDQRTVLDLLPQQIQKGLFPVGRLDKDTEGLLLLTDNGELAHRLLSPQKHVDKTYLVTLAHTLGSQEIETLEQGVDIGEKTLTRPAKVVKIKEKQILLTIQEGKYHQVKRMLHGVGNEVTALKRVSFGPLALDEKLSPGIWRELTEDEVNSLLVTDEKRSECLDE